MNVFNSVGNWFGFTGFSEPVVGISVSDTLLTMVAVRPGPTRVTAVVRIGITDAAVVGGDIRLPQLIAAQLKQGRRHMRLPAGTPAVIAVQPHADQFAVSLGSGIGREPEVEVSGSQFDRCSAVVASGGFRPDRIDVTPAALARIALTEYPGEAVAREAGGWQVSVSTTGFQGTRAEPLQGPELRLGPGRARPAAAHRLHGVDTARQLDDVFDPATDGVALGAALAGLGRMPLVAAVPAATGSAAAWMVQRVAEFS